MKSSQVRYKTKINTLSSILFGATVLGFAAPAQAQTTLFSTDFDTEHALGADNLAGVNNWASNAVNSGVQGIRQNGGNLYGYLGGAAPSDNFREVYQSTPYDPVGQGTPILNISMDFAVFDSANLEYDRFYVDIFNQDIELLGSIVFDNVSLGILSWDAVNELKDTGVAFTSGTFEQLAISINLATNRWNATYGANTLFANEVFHAGTSTLDYDSLTFTWEVTDPDNPGDNFAAFDNIQIQTATPEPSTFALLAGVVCLGGALLRRRK